MNIHDINHGVVKRRKTKRLGRGTGSGRGKTCGRGHKGQYTVSGSSTSLVFQGGQMPLYRRVPKRGFNNKFALTIGEVNIQELDQLFKAGDKVTPESLREKDVAKYRYDILKVLGTGELTKKLTVSAHRFSSAAREKIENAGGKIVELPTPRPVVKGRKKTRQPKK